METAQPCHSPTQLAHAHSLRARSPHALSLAIAAHALPPPPLLLSSLPAVLPLPPAFAAAATVAPTALPGRSGLGGSGSSWSSMLSARAMPLPFTGLPSAALAPCGPAGVPCSAAPGLACAADANRSRLPWAVAVVVLPVLPMLLVLAGEPWGAPLADEGAGGLLVVAACSAWAGAAASCPAAGVGCGLGFAASGAVGDAAAGSSSASRSAGDWAYSCRNGSSHHTHQQTACFEPEWPQALPYAVVLRRALAHYGTQRSRARAISTSQWLAPSYQPTLGSLSLYLLAILASSTL